MFKYSLFLKMTPKYRNMSGLLDNWINYIKICLHWMNCRSKNSSSLSLSVLQAASRIHKTQLIMMVVSTTIELF